jgi:hypothetical protein
MNHIGTLRFAREFLSAAALIKKPPQSEIEQFKCDITNNSIPAYSLICHSIELSLKSFLIARGYSELELAGKGKPRKKFGHNLRNLYDESVRIGLSGLVDSDSLLIDLINDIYCKKDLVYFSRGLTLFPKYALLYDFANRLICSVESHLSTHENQ